MSFEHFIPVSSNEGTLRINAYDFPASSWTYITHSSSIILRTASSMPWGDVRAGAKTLTIKATGFCKSDFNPFIRPAIKPYLGNYADITCIAKDNNTFARSPSALIVDWTFHDESNGSVSWSLEAMGDFTFQNMGGQTND